MPPRSSDLDPAPATAAFPMPLHMYPFPPSQPFVANSSPRPKRRQVKNACTNCQKACKKCDDARPCLRCVRYGVSEECVDSQRKARKRGIKRGPYKKRDGKGRAVLPHRRSSLILHQGLACRTFDTDEPHPHQSHPPEDRPHPVPVPVYYDQYHHPMAQPTPESTPIYPYYLAQNPAPPHPQESICHQSAPFYPFIHAFFNPQPAHLHPPGFVTVRHNTQAHTTQCPPFALALHHKVAPDNGQFEMNPPCFRH